MNVEDLQNRFDYHPADTDDKRAAHGDVRRSCYDLAVLINDVVPDGREMSLAITNLEQVMFWANAALVRQL